MRREAVRGFFARSARIIYSTSAPLVLNLLLLLLLKQAIFCTVRAWRDTLIMAGTQPTRDDPPMCKVMRTLNGQRESLSLLAAGFEA